MPRQLPPYMCCATCGRPRKAHDHANRIVLPADRHPWETPQTRDARTRRTKDQPALLPAPDTLEGPLL